LIHTTTNKGNEIRATSKVCAVRVSLSRIDCGQAPGIFTAIIKATKRINKLENGPRRAYTSSCVALSKDLSNTFLDPKG
jgi:hypothetical protein